ncbi:hypothetical protein SUGI_0184130 [Cryptomeria japonica]|nr:hypothetical protein SUGI_0184130 [Cryptomeria japonica]
MIVSLYFSSFGQFLFPLLFLVKPRFTEKGNDGVRKDTNEENCGDKEVSGDNWADEIRVRAFRVVRRPSGSRYLFSRFSGPNYTISSNSLTQS